MSEWTRVRLADVARIKHGYAFEGRYFSDRGPAPILVTPGNFMIGGGWQSAKPKYYLGPVPDGFVLRKGDLIVTMTDLSKRADTLGYAALVPDGGPFLHNQRIGHIEMVQPGCADLPFLHYVLRGPDYRNHVLASATGSTVRHTSPSRILEYELFLPGLNEQRAIAEVLGALDDKINLNQRAAGKANSLAFALFAAIFERPDTQRIRLGDLAAVADCLHSRKPELVIDSGYRYLVLSDIRDDGRLEPRPNFSISATDYREWTRRIEVREGDCVITNVGRVGAAAQIPSSVKAAVGRNMTAIRGLRNCPPGYLAEALRCASVRKEIAAKTDEGTVLSALNVRTIPDLALPGADAGTRLRFHEQVHPLHALQDALHEENARLAATRDALLPPLLSGELRVREAESLVGDTV